MGARELTTNRRDGRALERALLALILVLAFYLRTHDITISFIGPDDGSYMHSARLHVLQPGGFHPLRWIREDVAWAQELAELYRDEVQTYQHSYLHQLVTRYLFRFGCGALQALRTSTALTGVLGVFGAWWLCAALMPNRRRLALLAAAIVAFSPLHAFYSRTGWGQIGFTTFYLVWFVLLHRVLFVLHEDDRRGFVKHGALMLLAALASFGYQEGAATFFVASAIVLVLAPWIGAPPGAPTGWTQRVLGSPRTWTPVIAAAPIAAWLLALFWSPFAQSYWLNAQGRAGGSMSWIELKQTSIGLLAGYRVDLMLTWPVFALAVVGFFALWNAERVVVRHLVLSVLLGSLLLFLPFGDAWLLRIYMPLLVVVLVLAAAGLHAVTARLGSATVARALEGVGVGALFVVSWISLFGSVTNVLFIGHLYESGARACVDHRHVADHLIEIVRENRQPGERVAAYLDKASMFLFLDAGIAADVSDLHEPRAAWPKWILGRVRGLADSGQTLERGGPYRLVAQDTLGRDALYVLEP